MVNREKTLVALANALCNNVAGAGSTNFFHTKSAKIYFTQRAQSFFNTQRTQRFLITQRAQRDIVAFNSLQPMRNDFESSARTISFSRKVFLTRKERKGF